MLLSKSFLSGVIITIAGYVFLRCKEMGYPIIGAFMFTIGLVTILLFDWNLYTGKVCYIEKPADFYKIAMIWCYNSLGCVLTGIWLKNPAAAARFEVILNKSLIELIAHSILCGLLIYLSVEGYKAKHTLITTFLCVPVFIICGFEHSIADIGYAIMGNVPMELKNLFVLIIISLGNAVGGLIVPAFKHLGRENG